MNADRKRILSVRNLRLSAADPVDIAAREDLLRQRFNTEEEAETASLLHAQHELHVNALTRREWL